METKETNPTPTPTPNQSKMETEEIPVIDYAEVSQLILSRSLSLPRWVRSLAPSRISSTSVTRPSAPISTGRLGLGLALGLGLG